MAGGGLDLGFERAGFSHVASWDVLEDSAVTLMRNRPDWVVHGGQDGDVTKVRWRAWRGSADVVHGGPPCQPFSVAGRQRGSQDQRDMFPAFVEAVLGVEPLAFVAENVAALGGPKFRPYLNEVVLQPLGRKYSIREIELSAQQFECRSSGGDSYWSGFAASAMVRDGGLPPRPTRRLTSAW